MQTFRLFVSSPGDVMVERRRVENLVSRLNGEFAGVARLEPIRWETEHYQAHATFQDQIPASTACDIVIGILKWRLGTELPADFGERLPDGRPYPSGTAYEILSAVEQRRGGKKLPDIFVFRYAASSPTVALEDPDRARIEHDWQALKGFFQEWFLTERGHFKAAFNPYQSEDDFEVQLEALLRKWITDKVAGGRVVVWPTEVKGSPFRGLSAFGAKHAPVFFGRSADTARAVDIWREAGGRGSPYLLMVGASGSGKSSLARAGLVPRLTTPGVIHKVDTWRIAAMRPGDNPEGPFAALATALMQQEAGLPPEEEGRGPALPEIRLGDSTSPHELAAVLRHADAAAAVKPIVNALDRIATGERERERYGREVRCDLVLLIDQLEELFADVIREDERARFFGLMAALVATGRVWIAATLRADFYARMLVEPALKKLKEDGATYDLAPPGPVELAEIVREPATAAGLAFATDAATGERLDARLLRDADRPDMLPLVQLALARLYEGRESVGGEITLPLTAYKTLGGLKGIIDEAGETALACLGEAERAGLPRLLRQLAVPAHGQEGTGALTIRAVQLGQAAPDETSRHLVDALVAARLLTTSGAEADAQVRLAHQRVLEDWKRARTVAADSAEFYRIRADVEDSRRRWDAGKRRSELLLPRGLPLAEAEEIVRQYRDELAPELVAYVRTSRARANRAQVFAWSAAAVFLLFAIGAGIAAKVALDERAAAEAARAEAAHEAQRADRNFSAAKQTVDGLIFNIAQGLNNVTGMRVDTVRKILNTVQQTIEQLTRTAPGDPQLLRSREVMLSNFAVTYLAAGDIGDATQAATQSLDIARRLAAQDQDNFQLQRDVSLSLNKLGDVRLQAGDQAGALGAYQEALEVARKLAARDQSNPLAQLDVAESLGDVGDVKLQAGDRAGALVAYLEDLDSARKVAARDKGDAHAQGDVSMALGKLADAKLVNDVSGAIAAYQESLDIARKLAAQDQSSALAQDNVAVTLNRLGDAKLLGGDQAGALAAFQEYLDIIRKLAARDQGNARFQNDLSVAVAKLGNVELQAGNVIGALAADQEALEIARKVVVQDQSNARAQRFLALILLQLGDAKLGAGHQAEALAAYQESLDIVHKLAAQDRGNAQAQNDVAVTLNKLGDAKLQAGDQAGALAAFQEYLDVSRKLAAQDQGDARFQSDLSVALAKLGGVKLQAGDVSGALADDQEVLEIARKNAVQDQGNAKLRRFLASILFQLGDAKLQAADQVGALAAYQESLDIVRKLAAQDQGNALAQDDVAVTLNKLGSVKALAGDQAGALAAFQEYLDIIRKLAAQDQGSARFQTDLSVALVKLGGMKLQAGDVSGALAADQEALEIARKVAAQDQGNAQAQRFLAAILFGFGDAKLQAGDRVGALAAYQDTLDILRKLAALDQGNAQAQGDMLESLLKQGDVKLQSSDQAGALAAYQESLAIARKLASLDQGNVTARADLALCLMKVSGSQTPVAARAALTEALAILDRLDSEHQLTAAQQQWQTWIHDTLSKLP
jgi:eukaryotic-like serine/threonine-protein kinase